MLSLRGALPCTPAPIVHAVSANTDQQMWAAALDSPWGEFGGGFKCSTNSFSIDQRFAKCDDFGRPFQTSFGRGRIGLK
eukprot:377141-Rhodomonas_salina.2